MQRTSVELGDFAATLEQGADALEPFLAGAAGYLALQGSALLLNAVKQQRP